MRALYLCMYVNREGGGGGMPGHYVYVCLCICVCFDTISLCVLCVCLKTHQCSVLDVYKGSAYGKSPEVAA